MYLTKLRCTPKPRCLPLHSRHMNIPYDTEAHCGFLVLQSTQVCKCQRVLDLHPKGYDEVYLRWSVLVEYSQVFPIECSRVMLHIFMRARARWQRYPPYLVLSPTLELSQDPERVC